MDFRSSLLCREKRWPEICLCSQANTIKKKMRKKSSVYGSICIVILHIFYFYFYYITSQSLYSITRRIRISRLTTTPGSTTPSLYEECVGSLTSHSINIGKDCETGPTVFRPYPRRLESLTICRCHYKGSTFFSVIVKTLSVGPAGAWTRDLPLNRPVLSQLS